MPEIRPFQLGDSVAIVRAGRASSMAYVIDENDGVITLDDDTVWTVEGLPISAEMRGARLSYGSQRHADLISKAKLIARTREILDFLFCSERAYRLKEGRLVAVERILGQAVVDYLMAGDTVGKGDVAKTRLKHDIETFTKRLQAAEQAEVMRLSSRDKNR